MTKALAIFDPQFITQQGIQRLVDQNQLFSSTHIIDSEQDLIQELRETDASFLVIDYISSDQVSINSFKKVKKEFPTLKTLVISDDNDKARIQSIIKAGIKGFLTKSCSKKEILEAIDTIRDGGKFFCSKVVDIITTGEDFTYSELSEREMEIVKLISKGNSSAEIASRLNISVHTVNSHRKNILKKLGLKSPTELIIYAAERGWVGLS
ncbi:MAG: response regulator transcription factor [Roseivirga sp.]|nr:response regulator transcription factor [Roseivirga sp.]